MDNIEVHEEVLSRLEGAELAVVVVTATKPDFYKQWSLIPACEKLKVPVIVINTGQHYDGLLGFGLEEFNIKKYIAFDLKIRGDLLQKTYEMIAKTGFVARQLKERFPKTQFIPIVHGDTLAAGVFPIGWMFATAQKVAQNEAGIRGMAPVFDKDPETFINNQWEGKWSISRQEPFPEQWDTFVSGASSELHFAPIDLNKEHLIREGAPSDRIFTVGNSIVDAMEYTKRNKPEVSIFDMYPKLEEYETWIRVDLHRRANLGETRFKAFFSGIESLVKEGQPIAWVELPGTKFALEKYSLRNKVVQMDDTYDNFVFTPLWKSYSQVMEFFRSGRCAAALTDSGSMQEEMNKLGVPILTARYNTDRPETVYDAKTNILVPPHEGMVDNMVRFVMERDELLERMSHGKKLYGEDVGVKIIQKIRKLHDEGFTMMRTTPEVMGLSNKHEIEFL
ncbi:MAG: UDP-N-acetyl glucosamine 2-epimerase [Candidatus Altiarchaeota archaeon]|nr:UDP-N-acetyl glucosamine 2-epimerase [Candidatus Altiarchaeota archaeon]